MIIEEGQQQPAQVDDVIKMLCDQKKNRSSQTMYYL